MRPRSPYRPRHKLLLAGAGFLGCVLVLVIALHTGRLKTVVPASGRIGLPHASLSVMEDSVAVSSLQLFLTRMDSLQRDVSGKRLYDSLCLVRPGLLDSVRFAIRYYSLRHWLK